jgi:alkyl hydroperoxide reductase subunit AhpC
MLIGQQAPDFTAAACMPDNTFDNVTLSKHKGKYVVLYFWPADFTYVCASETLDFHKRLEEFKSRGCDVLGVSIDTTHVHKAWKNTEKKLGGLGTQINHPMISDNLHEIGKKYDVLLPIGLAVRAVFLIDPKGVVRCEMKNDLPLGRNVEEVLRVLDACIFTDQNGDQVCPSGWKKGAPAMKASTEGVTEYLTKYT